MPIRSCALWDDASNHANEHHTTGSSSHTTREISTQLLAGMLNRGYTWWNAATIHADEQLTSRDKNPYQMRKLIAVAC